MTTSANFSGLVRECLVADDHATVRVVSMVRECLVAKVGIPGHIAVKSFGNANLAVVAGGVVLTGRAHAKSHAKSAALSQTYNLAGKISAACHARLLLTTTVSLAGKIHAAARAQIAALDQQTIAGRITAQSSGKAGGVAPLAARTSDYAVMIIT